MGAEYPHQCAETEACGDMPTVGATVQCRSRGILCETGHCRRVIVFPRDSRKETPVYGVEAYWEPSSQEVTAGTIRKQMATVFWDQEGILMVDWLPPNSTINSDQYCNSLQQLRRPFNNAVVENGAVVFFSNKTMHDHMSVTRPLPPFVN